MGTTISNTVGSTSFQEVQFPAQISYGSKGGSGFNTTVFESTSGYEQRNVNWSQSRGKWSVNQAIKSLDDMNQIIMFFNAMYGRAYAFRFKDWSDYIVAGQQIGVGDGTTLAFQCNKTYETGLTNGQTYVRKIAKPVTGSFTGLVVGSAAADPSTYALDYTTGIFTFTTPPAVGLPIIVSYLEFDVPARFDTDALDITQDFFQVQSWENITITEIRL